MRKILVACVVGLTPKHLESAPFLSSLAEQGGSAALETVLPAVTCTVQSSLLTGKYPTETGIVANGWYFRELSEVKFWCQSNSLVSGPKIWESARDLDPNFTCAKLFWWYNMYSSADWSVTPRPAYPADGRKIPDIYSEPPELRTTLNQSLGQFPLFNFWGPTADIVSSKWIVDAGLHILDQQKPNLALVYLPHLDYNLQRLGPSDPKITEDIKAIDQQLERLANHARERDYDVVVVSEYGISDVDQAIHINRVLRGAGYIRVQNILDSWELLDCGACKAFAVADHQLAHVYVRQPKDIAAVAKLLEKQAGIERVYVGDQRKEIHLDHPRSGEIIAVAAKNAWFTYYYWDDDTRAPDFARTVDIHRKPGYDPVELFLDPNKAMIKAQILAKVARKKLGFRMLMNVIPLDASLVKGSHGRLPDTPEEGPMVLWSWKDSPRERIHATEFKDFLLERFQA